MTRIRLAKGESVLVAQDEYVCTGRSAKYLFQHTWTQQTVKTIIVLGILATAITGLLQSQYPGTRLASIILGFVSFGLYLATLAWAASFAYTSGAYLLPFQLWSFLKTIAIFLALALALVSLFAEGSLSMLVLSIVTLSVWALSQKNLFQF